MTYATAFEGIAGSVSRRGRPRVVPGPARVATIVELRGRPVTGGEASFLYAVREGGDAQGMAVYAARARGAAGAGAARARAFRWCREHGYEVAGFIEVPPRREAERRADGAGDSARSVSALARGPR